MPSDRIRQALEDMVEHIDLIFSLTRKMQFASFQEDHVKRAAIERWLQNVTEAAFRLGEDAERICPGPDWRNIRGLGNWLRHAYDALLPDVLWETVTTRLEPLRSDVVAALKRLGPEGPE